MSYRLSDEAATAYATARGLMLPVAREELLGLADQAAARPARQLDSAGTGWLSARLGRRGPLVKMHMRLGVIVSVEVRP